MPGDGSASCANYFGRWAGLLASDDYFVEIVFGQEKLRVGVRLKQFLDGPIGIDALYREAGRLLGFNAVSVGHVITAEAGIRSGVLGVKEGEHTAAGTQAGAKTLDHRADQLLGHVIQR